MNNSLLTFVFAAIILNISCTKNNNTTWAEKHAVGQYSFEKVAIHADGMKTKNVTQDYYNMVLQLNDKKEAALIDRNNNITYFGKYDIVEQTSNTTTDDDGNTTSTTERTIIIDIKKNGRGGDYHWVGQNASFGKKLRFTAKKADGRYVFKLDKI